MPRFTIPNSVSIQNARSFFASNTFFARRGRRATIAFHRRWVHMEPIALAMAAAWGAWCRRNDYEIRATNLGSRARYAARMKLFEHLGIDFQPEIHEREEAGRFVPITQIQDRDSLRAVMADISALLHLDDEPETLAAAQYCVSELLRNVLEHSGSEDGAFVCAHNFSGRTLHRVSIAVADCGRGIRDHLEGAHPAAGESDEAALTWALRPGITGAQAGIYGTPDNAGAGLFITRCIAKGSGGYFLVASGDAGYRLPRAGTPEQQSLLMENPLHERHDLWAFPSSWQGTVVALEIRTDEIADFQGYFSWIRDHLPPRAARRRIRFT